MIRYTYLFVLFMLVSISSSAQKYGHVNFGNLLASMPDTKTAEEELKVFNDQLLVKGQEMAQALEKRFEEIKKLQPTTAPVKMKEYEEELQRKQLELRQYEQQVAQQTEDKRRELLSPIIQRARDAIDAVAKAGDYQLVFDTSRFNTILFAEDSTDLTDTVIKHLATH